MARKGFGYQPKHKRVAAGAKGGRHGPHHQYTHKEAVDAGRKGARAKTGPNKTRR